MSNYLTQFNYTRLKFSILVEKYRNDKRNSSDCG
jgi:hypothetical protein